MRIDDFDNQPESLPVINIEDDMAQIDLLISDINNTENVLRRRHSNKKYKHSDHTPIQNSFKYITNNDVNDIDDVVIDIDIPNDYYTNKERSIVPYNNNIVTYVVYMICLKLWEELNP